MSTNRLLSIIAGAVVLAGCATAAPKELVGAREAYRRASTGSAATVAPADVHVAEQALDKAERAFKKDHDSYRTRDLAYVAQRKSEIAEARASITNEQKNQVRANADFQATQGTMVAEAKQDLSDARKALASSERAGEKTAEKLSAERDARAAAEQEAVTSLERLSAEQKARSAAEQQAAASQAALAKLAAVRDEPRGMVITLSGSVLFASNRSTLLPESRRRLDQVADVLLTTRERNLTIEGHTDSLGSDSKNLELSQARADAVRNYLVGRDYQADRVTAHGLGESHPVADNATAEGRANNRRVEIIIAREPHASNP
jgi:outer membrane protein OmpA-like peptidoglycan-associated protein